MKLSELVYLCIKNSLMGDQDSFNKEDFLLGKWDGSSDYGTSIKNVFTPLNEAVARLNDLNKIPYAVAEANAVGNLVDVSNLDINRVYNVAVLLRNKYMRIGFTPLGTKKLMIETAVDGVVYVEYKVNIPAFNRNDIPTKNQYGELTTTDVDLNKEYGINNSMCQYIIEYTCAKLYETTDVVVSNMHITRAEQYFNNLDRVQMAFPPSSVNCTFKIGE